MAKRKINPMRNNDFGSSMDSVIRTALEDRNAVAYFNLVNSSGRDIEDYDLYSRGKAELLSKKEMVKEARKYNRLRPVYEQYKGVNFGNLPLGGLVEFLEKTGHDRVRVKGGEIELDMAMDKDRPQVYSFAIKEINKMADFIKNYEARRGK